MKRNSYTRFTARQLLNLALTVGLLLPLPALAASVQLATSPLATTTTSSVSPNLMFILDDSGSMGWNYMPDNANDFDGNYGFASNQCNGVYYDPAITYKPPVNSYGVSYSDASFNAAWTNGFSTGAGTTNLDTSFSPTSSYTAGKAFYYAYTGTQTTAEKKDYYKTTGIFYRECNSVIGSTTLVDGVNPVNTLFTKHRLSTAETTTITIAAPGSPTATAVSSIKVNGVELLLSGATLSTTSATTLAASVAAGINAVGYTATASGSVVTITGPTSAADYMPVITKSGNLTFTTDVFPDTKAAKLTNFANWYSYYRTRMLMMKTSVGLAFKPITDKYRVGFMTINNNVSPDAVDEAPFWNNTNAALGPVTTHKADWYAKLYGSVPNNSTPLREALAKAGLFYAHKLSGNTLNGIAVNDPIQYSCQQNFTILSTDGFWNGNAGYKLDGSTAVGNQDGVAPRPMYDGGQLNKTTSQVTQTQTQLNKSTSQIQKQTVQIQSRTSSLQSITSALQQLTTQQQEQRKELQFATGALQTATSSNGGSSWSAWSNVGTCTVDTSGSNRRRCRYDTLSGWTNATATCTANDESAKTSNGDTWSGNKVSCQYNTLAAVNVATCTPVAQSGSSPYTVLTAKTCPTSTTTATVSSCTVAPVNGSGVSIACSYVDGAAVNVSSCTDVAKSTGSPYSGPATTCLYTAFTAWGNVSSCTAAAQSAGSPYTVGTATACQTTDTGWVNSASCTAGVTGGQTVTCQTLTTGPTAVASCTSGSTSCTSPITASSCIVTSCTTLTVMPTTLVASCTPASASASNNYVATICNPTSSTISNVASCTPQTATSGNGWSTVTCSGGAGGTSDTLADVAMYYYVTDLRTLALGNCGAAVLPATEGPLCLNNVFVSGADNNVKQHMTTFTLGLGARGRMVFSPDYSTQTVGDFASVKNGSATNLTSTPPVCSWQSAGTACNWPVPAANAIENIDDLWHAAVNGRGNYFSATDPASLASGLAGALSSITARKGSAAAAATSTLNPVSGDNFAYVASYTTVKWTGNLEARTINTTNGVISEAATWCVENTIAGTCSSPGTIVSVLSGNSTNFDCVTPGATVSSCPSPGVFDSAASTCSVPMPIACTGTMPSKVAAASDTRTIKTAGSTGLVDFIYANLNSADFDATRIGSLSQWPALTATQQAAAAGANLVNFLRGQYGYEDRPANLVGPVDNRLFRYREAVFGDALESQPSFLGKPKFPYTDITDPGYPAFKAAQAARPGTVFVGANDGMMHAFDANNGVERWAYVPSMVIPNMWKLADKSYDIKHTNFVNGSPTISDVCTIGTSCTAADWRTILVGGLNGGGRGYYALDVTNPVAPALLWEFTTASNANVGYSFGRPVITKLANGTWVVLVTSGYNNTSPGDGKGYLYVLNATTGAIIRTLSTGVGDTSTPSGLAKIAAWNAVPASNQAGYTYGGDLLGNVWRFDINTDTNNVFKFATLFSDAAGTNPQAITTVPVLGEVLKKRVIFVGTGKYLETPDLTDTQIQSMYAIKDDNATSTLVNPRAYTVPPTTTPPTAGQMVKQTITTTGSSRVMENTLASPNNVNPVNFSFDRGWYLDWPNTGERVNIDSKLVQGTLLVPTIVPSNTVCSPGGYGWFNFLNFETGQAVKDNTGVGVAGTNTVVSEKYDSTIVGFNVIYIDGKPIVEVVTSFDPTPHVDINVVFIPSTPKFKGKRAIWRELIP